MERLYSIDDVKRYSDRHGYHFFDKWANRFFNSRAGNRILQVGDKVYFVTSERFDDDHERLYTARVLNEDGSTGEAFGSTFQQFVSSRQSWAFIERNAR